LQDPPKFTQIWILGLKTNHLATLDCSDKKLTVGECRTLPSLRFAFVRNVFRQNGLAVVQPADGADGEAVSAAKDADVIADVHAAAARIDLDRHRGCKKMIELCRFFAPFFYIPALALCTQLSSEKKTF
jgi:hypothetical protein